MSAHLDGLPATTPVEIWFQDEARIGQKNGLVRQWARRGTRPRQPADQRYDNAYLFGAICPARGVGAALALPYADTDMMQLHLDEISRTVAAGAHAVLLLDRAGWHTTAKLEVPANITPIFLPSRAPELNPVENVWQFLRSNWLSNLVFDTYDEIIDAACDAWRNLEAHPEKSRQSACESGRISVTAHDSWYNARDFKPLTRIFGIRRGAVGHYDSPADACAAELDADRIGVRLTCCQSRESGHGQKRSFHLNLPLRVRGKLRIEEHSSRVLPVSLSNPRPAFQARPAQSLSSRNRG